MSVEKAIEELARTLEEGKGYQIPRRVEDMPELPFETYEQLLQATKTGKITLLRFSFEPSTIIFSRCARAFERFLMTAYGALSYLTPVIAIALGYFISWWFLVGVLFYFSFISAGKKLFNRVIFRNAFTSESVFCFLFFSGQISVSTVDRNTQYYFNREAMTVKVV
jgi:hypothetical protein